MFLAAKTPPEETTGRILEEIERAEKIFRKMCDGGELEEEIKARSARQAATAIKRIMR